MVKQAFRALPSTMDPIDKKKEAKYSWALDENNKLVHISTLYRQLRETGELGRYFCPGCNREMRACLPKEETKRIKYFAHDSKSGCGEQTYLHKLGKLLLKEKFDSEKPFEIGIQHPVVCAEAKSCPFFDKEKCSAIEPKTYNLKVPYDTCSIEEQIPSKTDPSGYFQADLLLLDSHGKHPPMLLEIAVTHFVGEKKAEDGHLIIEIPVKKEEHIERYKDGPIIEKSSTQREAIPMPVFYGPFKRLVGTSLKCLNRKGIARVIVEHDSIECTSIEDNVECSRRMERLSSTSLLEMNFDMNSYSGPWRDMDPTWRAFAFAVDNGIQFRPQRYPTRYMLDRARKQLREMPWEVVYQRK